MNATARQKYHDVKNQRQEFIDMSTEAFGSGDIAKGNEYLEKAKEFNPTLTALEDLLEEEARFAGKAPTAALDKDAHEKAKERADVLRKGGKVHYDIEETMKALGLVSSKALLLGDDGLLFPSRVDTTIRDGGKTVSSIVDQVSTINLTGTNHFSVPIAVKDLQAYGGDPVDLSGTLRQESKNEFDYAEIAPYELNVTTYVPRNLGDLTTIDYEGYVRRNAMKALRIEIAKLIYNGEGNKVFGIKNGQTHGGKALTGTATIPEIAPGFLDELIFGYGSNEEQSAFGRLFLTRKTLKAIGKLRYDDGKRVYGISVSADNPNTGYITEDGVATPYTIGSALTDFDAAGANDISMVYGDPTAYLLGFFGNYDVRVDHSYKAGERLLTVLGDVMVGGNVVTPGGFMGVVKGA